MLRRPPPWSLGRSQSERSFPLTSFTGFFFCFSTSSTVFLFRFFTSSPKSDCIYLWTAPYRNCISHNNDFNDDDDDDDDDNDDDDHDDDAKVYFSDGFRKHESNVALIATNETIKFNDRVNIIGIQQFCPLDGVFATFFSKSC